VSAAAWAPNVVLSIVSVAIILFGSRRANGPADA
jgi:hypothetical protein